MSAITRYRKREPIEVDAARVTSDSAELVAAWCGGRVMQYGDDHSHTIIKLLTKDRLQVAITGDYIVKDNEGYFHVWKVGPFVFEYEPIQGDEKVVAETKENKE